MRASSLSAAYPACCCERWRAFYLLPRLLCGGIGVGWLGRVRNAPNHAPGARRRRGRAGARGCQRAYRRSWCPSRVPLWRLQCAPPPCPPAPLATARLHRPHSPPLSAPRGKSKCARHPCVPSLLLTLLPRVNMQLPQQDERHCVDLWLSASLRGPVLMQLYRPRASRGRNMHKRSHYCAGIRVQWPARATQRLTWRASACDRAAALREPEPWRHDPPDCRKTCEPR